MFDAASTAAHPPQDCELRRPGDACAFMLLRATFRLHYVRIFFLSKRFRALGMQILSHGGRRTQLGELSKSWEPLSTETLTCKLLVCRSNSTLGWSVCSEGWEQAVPGRVCPQKHTSRGTALIALPVWPRGRMGSRNSFPEDQLVGCCCLSKMDT